MAGHLFLTSHHISLLITITTICSNEITQQETCFEISQDYQRMCHHVCVCETNLPIPKSGKQDVTEEKHLFLSTQYIDG